MSKPLTVAICGAGAMGSGIAQVAAQAGCTVVVIDVQAAALATAEARMRSALQALVARGKIPEGTDETILARITWSPDLAALTTADLVIEAIIEDAAVKAELFARIEAFVRDDAIIVSNTSSLPISRLARGLRLPERFVGMHFFNPAPVMKLVEVIAGAGSHPAHVDRVREIAEAWGKVAIPVADVPGFIVNRVARPFYAEAFTALNEGAADPATIDALFRAARFRMGPLELTDLIGQDVNFAVARSVYDSYFGRTRFVPQRRQAALVDAGWLGHKTKRGVYDYAGTPALVLTAPAAGFTDEHAQAAAVLMAVGEPIVASDGNLIGHTRGETARSEASRHGRPVALLDWFDSTGEGPVGYAASTDAAAGLAEGVLGAIGRAGHRIADRPGLIVMRTLAQIANAAADAVLEQVADARGIDAALRYGANYPFGIFDWIDRIGRARVVAILEGIAAETGDTMYRPSQHLRRTA